MKVKLKTSGKIIEVYQLKHMDTYLNVDRCSDAHEYHECDFDVVLPYYVENSNIIDSFSNDNMYTIAYLTEREANAFREISSKISSVKHDLSIYAVPEYDEIYNTLKDLPKVDEAIIKNVIIKTAYSTILLNSYYLPNIIKLLYKQYKEEFNVKD